MTPPVAVPGSAAGPDCEDSAAGSDCDVDCEVPLDVSLRLLLGSWVAMMLW